MTVRATDRDRSADGRVTNSLQKWASVVFSAAVVLVVSWMTIEAPTKPLRPREVDAGTDASVPAHDTEAKAAAAAADGGTPGAATEDLDAGLFLTAPSLGDASLMPSTGGPRSVKIGIVLVAFQGAEGASSTARNKRDALAIAERLGQDARSDFHHAVSGGDPGSSDDIGRLPRGVLDPRTETVVFALAPGEVSDVLETPKGYWIVKRLE